MAVSQARQENHLGRAAALLAWAKNGALATAENCAQMIPHFKCGQTPI
jgi:hypothetical protein